MLVRNFLIYIIILVCCHKCRGFGHLSAKCPTRCKRSRRQIKERKWYWITIIFTPPLTMKDFTNKFSELFYIAKRFILYFNINNQLKKTYTWKARTKDNFSDTYLYLSYPFWNFKPIYLCHSVIPLFSVYEKSWSLGKLLYQCLNLIYIVSFFIFKWA